MLKLYIISLQRIDLGEECLLKKMAKMQKLVVKRELLHKMIPILGNIWRERTGSCCEAGTLVRGRNVSRTLRKFHCV